MSIVVSVMVKRKKRYLNDKMKNMYEYLTAYPQTKLLYSYLFALFPKIWVYSSKNFKYLTIIHEENVDVPKLLCCAQQHNDELCFQRKCDRCKEKSAV